MTNVIEFSKYKKEPDEEQRWIVDLSIFESERQTSARIIDANMDDEDQSLGDRYRYIADRLDDLAFIFRQYAEAENPSERGAVIATATIFEDSTVRVRTDENKVVTDEQKEWVKRRLDDAKTVDDLRAAHQNKEDGQ